MISKAQKEATSRYNKKNTITICLRLSRIYDKDIIEALELADNKSGYIKDLIRADIHN